MQEPAQVTAVGGIPVVAMFGESDVANVSELRTCLDEARAQARHEGVRDVIVSLLHAEYFDSSTVHTLLTFAAQLKRDSRRLLVVRPSSESGRRILAIFGIARVLPLFDTMPEALSTARSLNPWSA